MQAEDTPHFPFSSRIKSLSNLFQDLSIKPGIEIPRTGTHWATKYVSPSFTINGIKVPLLHEEMASIFATKPLRDAAHNGYSTYPWLMTSTYRFIAILNRQEAEGVLLKCRSLHESLPLFGIIRPSANNPRYLAFSYLTNRDKSVNHVTFEDSNMMGVLLSDISLLSRISLETGSLSLVSLDMSRYEMLRLAQAEPYEVIPYIRERVGPTRTFVPPPMPQKGPNPLEQLKDVYARQTQEAIQLLQAVARENVSMYSPDEYLGLRNIQRARQLLVSYEGVATGMIRENADALLRVGIEIDRSTHLLSVPATQDSVDQVETLLRPYDKEIASKMRTPRGLVSSLHTETWIQVPFPLKVLTLRVHTRQTLMYTKRNELTIEIIRNAVEHDRAEFVILIPAYLKRFNLENYETYISNPLTL